MCSICSWNLEINAVSCELVILPQDFLGNFLSQIDFLFRYNPLVFWLTYGKINEVCMHIRDMWCCKWHWRCTNLGLIQVTDSKIGEFTVVWLVSLLQKDEADIWDDGGSSFFVCQEIIWVVGKSDKEHRETRVSLIF